MGVFGYKRTDLDMTCMGFKYEVGKTYEIPEEDLKPCEKGFHFCKTDETLNYYKDPTKSILLEVEALGKIIDCDNSKSVTNKLRIVAVLYNPLDKPGKDNLGACNTGNRNTGNYNTGNDNTGNHNSGSFNSGNSNSGGYNSGDYNSGLGNTGDNNSGNFNTGSCNTGIRNTGDHNEGNSNTGGHNAGKYNTGYYNNGNYNSGSVNTGDYNTGDCNTGTCNTGNHNSGKYNTGDYNSGNYNSGMFNTTEPKMRLFNKDTEYTVSEFNIKFEIPRLLWFELIANKTFKESFKIHFDDYPEEEREKDIEEIKQLPNFDADIFEEIFGVRI